MLKFKHREARSTSGQESLLHQECLVFHEMRHLSVKAQSLTDTAMAGVFIYLFIDWSCLGDGIVIALDLLCTYTVSNCRGIWTLGQVCVPLHSACPKDYTYLKGQSQLLQLSGAV